MKYWTIPPCAKTLHIERSQMLKIKRGGNKKVLFGSKLTFVGLKGYLCGGKIYRFGIKIHLLWELNYWQGGERAPCSFFHKNVKRKIFHHFCEMFTRAPNTTRKIFLKENTHTQLMIIRLRNLYIKNEI